MPLFEFKLTPLLKISGWRDENAELCLHWFGLTDGYYFINVGEEQLFRYSKDIIEHWSKSNPDLKNSGVFFNYQVSSIYEDLLSILPNILQAVPSEIFDYISTIKKQKMWSEKLKNIFESTDSEEIDKTYYLASEWLNHRYLQGLGGGPNIWFIRAGDFIYIRWNNESINYKGIQVWSSTLGEYCLSVEEFMKEVKFFHLRLIDNMNERVQYIATCNPLPHIKIDVPQLIKEQNERKESLDNALSYYPTIESWNDVIIANNKLKNII